MRYSEYFVQVALLAEKGDVVEAERLLREAERYSQKSVTNHAALCAKAWAWYLKNPDNAVRCLLEAECNNSDVRSLLEIAYTYIELTLHETACKRCIKRLCWRQQMKKAQCGYRNFSANTLNISQ